MSLSHFTKQPDEVTFTLDARGLSVCVRGFVTREMVLAAVRRWANDPEVRARRAVPRRVLVDLQDIAGFDRSACRVVHDLVSRATQLGTQRIAVLASSAVLRTAVRLASCRTRAALRSFEHPTEARRWLDRESTGSIATLVASSPA